MSSSEVLLEVTDLSVGYPGAGFLRRRQPVPAVRGVSLSIGRGETLGLVGESGSGKSTIGKAILGLVRPTGGRIVLSGHDITYANGHERRGLAEHLQVVFQDPHASLSPSLTVGATLAEPLRVVRRMSRRDAADLVIDMLRRVGLSPDSARSYPAQLSGGQRQRVAIARALMLEPELVVCDEPTSALDLSVQAQILNLLLDLQQQFGVSYLFISHDIGVIRHISHRVAVLLKGQVMELADIQAFAAGPHHPYTEALLAAVPVPDPRRQAQRRLVRAAARAGSPAAVEPGSRVSVEAGSLAAVEDSPYRGAGCPFAGRCPSEVDKCATVAPLLLPMPESGSQRCQRPALFMACHVRGRTAAQSETEMAAA
jgi:ABC-type glutathione transport system ATPase component